MVLWQNFDKVLYIEKWVKEVDRIELVAQMWLYLRHLDMETFSDWGGRD